MKFWGRLPDSNEFRKNEERGTRDKQMVYCIGESGVEKWCTTYRKRRVKGGHFFGEIGDRMACYNDSLKK